MMKHLIILLSLAILIASCGDGQVSQEPRIAPTGPVISGDGALITFPDTQSISFFETEIISNQKIEAELKAPGKIVANVLPSAVGASQNIILFDNPELSSHYTQLIQLRININQIENINIKQKQLELERMKDLLEHGAATGQDLLNAETELSMEQTRLENEKAGMIEHETQLRSGGFRPEMLQKAKAGTAYFICDIPENQINKIRVGQSAKTVFTAFPIDTITGRVDAVADIVDPKTRMVKVRILINNSSGRLKTGMFANVSFGLSEGNFVSVNERALITIQSKHYVFVKSASDSFERREVQIGAHMGDRIVVFSGLEEEEEVAIQGVLQLKGLSFGY